jgi:hypothetical protein
MDWVTEPHPIDPAITAAVERVQSLLPSKRGVPIINARDCELAGFNLADVLAAAKLGAW